MFKYVLNIISVIQIARLVIELVKTSASENQEVPSANLDWGNIFYNKLFTVFKLALLTSI